MTMNSSTSGSTHALTLSCKVAHRGADGVTLAVEAVNNSGEVVHIIDSKRLPYLVREQDGSIVALYGVNEPDPDMDYYAIEIPLTRPLGPGERFEDELQLVPLVLRDHFDGVGPEVQVEGTLRVRCRLAFGRTPIEKPMRHRMNINALLAWQIWVDAPELQIDVPAAAP